MELATNGAGYWRGHLPAGPLKATITPPAVAGNAPNYHVRTGEFSFEPGAVHEIALEGWTELAPWGPIYAAIQSLRDGPASVTVTYSFIAPGTTVSNTGASVTITDHVDGTLSTSAFKQQIIDAFAQWKALFEDTFCVAGGYDNDLTVNFLETVESTSPSLFGPYVPRSGGVGDFRIGMWDMDGTTQTLAYAYGPQNAPHVAAGDILFNSSIDWRMDDDVTDGEGGDGGYSVLYTAIHEIGHAIGIGHHLANGSMMAPRGSVSLSVHARFPEGLQSSHYERAALRGIYAP